MFDTLREHLGSGADAGDAAQAGLLCVLQSIIPIFDHYVLQYLAVLPRWGLDQYLTYVGSSHSNYAAPSCASFFPGMPLPDVSSLMAAAGTVANEPSVTADYIPAVDLEGVKKAAMALGDQSRHHSASARAYWQSQVATLNIIISLSAAIAVISVAALALMPYFLASKTTGGDFTAHYQFRAVEDRAKLIPQFVHYISTLRGDKSVRAALRGTFLCKIETFVNRVHPPHPADLLRGH